MKKRVVMLLVLALSIVLAVQNAAATACSLNATLVNQDPYPAVPGDYVKIIFQLSGVDNPECEEISFELREQFPFSLDPDESNQVKITGGTYVRTYKSDFLIPYKIRVHEDAIDGENS